MKMDIRELNEQHARVIDHVVSNRVHDAFNILRGLATLCRDKDLQQQLSDLRDIYRNILRYSFELGDDPEKEKVYSHLQKSILELADGIREDILYHNHMLSYYRNKPAGGYGHLLSEQESSEIADSLAFKKEIEYILQETGTTTVQGERQGQDYKRALNRIFQLILLTDKFREAEISLVKEINDARIIPWYDKAILVSALTLSLIRFFDPDKINLLFDFYEKKEEQVWERALTGLFVSFYHHDKRLHLYPEVVQRLKVVKGNRKLEKSLASLIIQFLKAKETEKITKKIREEILPEMLRMKPTLDQKLSLDDILGAAGGEDKNPDWKTVFKDTPDLYSKIEQFTNMQIEGSDVFLSAFAMLKRFPFFDSFNNWFMPFHKDNDDLADAIKSEKGSVDTGLFAEGLERSSYLCNSDKYSFCLNIRYIPSQQKAMMMELFNMELKAMNEMEQTDEMVDNTLRERTIYTQYLQDLYRFYKLHPARKEFDDVFSEDIDFLHSNLFRLLLEDKTILRNIGEFYFEQGYYQQAIRIFEGLCITLENAELFEKTGYSYQELGDYASALEYYHKAELSVGQKEWVLRKIAWCSRKLGDYNRALDYYKQLERLKPDDLAIQASIGNTLLDMEDHEQALKYYFKVEYMDPGNHKIHRPIAWCSFVLGRFDNADKYFRKVIEKEGNRNDYMNLGHVSWCKGEKRPAIDLYRKSLELAGNDFEWFGGMMEEDRKYLVKYGIKEFDIPLMIDYLKINR
jgi:tetratricopeptide (TPR) repeat protein